ncbi:tetratricopeptide repeat protein [Chloroflexota bacterium]
MMYRGHITLLLVLLLLVIGILVGCGPARGTAEWHFHQGNNFNEQGHYDEAIEEYTKSIELDPKLALAYVNRAKAYNEKGQYDLAIVDCNKAIELDPKLDVAYGNRGIAYGSKGQSKESFPVLTFQHFNGIIKSLPKDEPQRKRVIVR